MGFAFSFLDGTVVPHVRRQCAIRRTWRSDTS